MQINRGLCRAKGLKNTHINVQPIKSNLHAVMVVWGRVVRIICGLSLLFSVMGKCNIGFQNPLFASHIIVRKFDLFGVCHSAWRCIDQGKNYSDLFNPWLNKSLKYRNKYFVWLIKFVGGGNSIVSWVAQIYSLLARYKNVL